MTGYNEHYVGSRLLYSSNTEEADEAFRDLFFNEVTQLVKTTLFSALAAIFVVTVIYFFTLGLLLWLAFDAGAAWLVWQLLAGLIFIGVWFVPGQEFTGRWELSFENSNALVESAAMLIIGQMQEKWIPAAASVTSKKHAPNEQERYYILVNRQEFQGYVSVLGFGTDMYVTWSMWRHRTPISMVIRWFSDMWRTMNSRGSILPKYSRNDPERAFREAIHDCVRAGVELALLGNRETVAGTFGSNIRLEDNLQAFTTFNSDRQAPAHDSGPEVDLTNESVPTPPSPVSPTPPKSQVPDMAPPQPGAQRYDV